ncbi:Eco57I restriction-modification methylase domain-containing protein [Haloplanus halophilus]|uniref:Eco57I restriction-modification methylase domain-containing protein n=1 Tax=Haloplanus halophilus TaxID=2949993 RepID=UPI00273A6090|nr:N-6 DNA methylase [Haloplanus sp. GDY1]
MSQATLSERPYVNSNLFSGHYLDERVRERDEWECDEEARAAMDDLQSLYELEGSLVGGYGEDALIDNWIDEVLDVLGFGTQEEVTLPNGGGFVDELLFETPTARRDAAEVYLGTEDTTDLFERGIGVVEAKQWDADFAARFSEGRPYRNASHQVKHYLEHTTGNVQWGVLTNGRKWRLYGTNDYETQTYYEVDLPELLERGDLEAFKYFYVFFRPAAFHETAGTTFLDEVWSESETASQELGEDLQDNVFTALRVLGRGFVETNDDLDIDPGDEAALDELKEQSLVFLYRLMFVLYAESRGLIHPESGSARDEYDENFSLDALRLDVHDAIGEVDEGFAEEFSDYSTTMWSRLEDLFRLIDEGEADLGIPPYNGGLFDHETHGFLTDHEVSNQYLAEVIYRLSTTRNDEGRYVLADYADLDTRHLGSVYEGLLEHQFRIAPEGYAAVAEDGGQVWKPATEVSVAEAVETVPEGGLYVVNDEGERKATGAYYTPDYVVTYIVEETVGPLVDEIREDLIEQGFDPGTQEYLGPFLRRVTDLRILDPAMGSGHFLTKATGYLSERVMEEVRDIEVELGGYWDEQHVRREIAKECIYGVDLNGMAVELAKLSMWLETLAADRPLAFLDHHFKEGNSLVGSDIEAIEELESDANGDDGQASLAEFGATREGTIERLMEIYGEFLAIENEDIADVREMKRKYAEIEQDELRQRLVAMANVHTAERFDLDVPSGAYERMARALEDDGEWAEVEETDWFRSAQATATEQEFFHWKLEFPEAFYDESGSIKSQGGFDAVIGNPPYVPTEQIPERQRSYLTTVFEVLHRKYDLSVAFLQQTIRLARDEGRGGMITPVAWETGENYSKFRKTNLTEGMMNLEKIINLPFDVFQDAYIDTNISIFRKSQPSGKFLAKEFEKRLRIESADVMEEGSELIPQSYLSETDGAKIFFRKGTYEMLTRFNREEFTDLGELTDATQGIVASFHEYSNSKENGDFLEYRECDVYRYELETTEQRYIDFGDEDNLRRYYTNPRILIRRLVNRDDRLMATIANDSFVVKKDLNPFIKTSDTPLKYILACVNSSLHSYLYISQSALALKDDFRQTTLAELQNLPIRVVNEEPNGSGHANKYDELSAILSEGVQSTTKVIDELDMSSETDVSVGQELLIDLADEIIDLKEDRRSINTALLDYITPYTDGPAITDVATYNPPSGVADTKLAATAEDYENLRIGTVTVDREGDGAVTINATARYKPDDEDAHDTDQWGYTETDPIPAMRLTDLSATEADLVEAFVPVAVEEAGGFAGFRETATKTNSLIDRLEAITLPDPDDVADDLERYVEAVERAEELDEKIRRTDDLIDDVVYELYGLTDEEIDIVEDAVGD